MQVRPSVSLFSRLRYLISRPLPSLFGYLRWPNCLVFSPHRQLGLRPRYYASFGSLRLLVSLRKISMALAVAIWPPSVPRILSFSPQLQVSFRPRYSVTLGGQRVLLSLLNDSSAFGGLGFLVYPRSDSSAVGCATGPPSVS